MKSAFLSFILFFFFMFTSLVNGQNTAPLNELENEPILKISPNPRWVPCSKQGFEILNTLKEAHGEKIVAIGIADVSPINGDTATQLLFFWNSETKTYTLIEMKPNREICVILTGKDLVFLENVFPTKPNINFKIDVTN